MPVESQRTSPKQDLFDLSDHYEQMLQRGIRLSGEEQHFFIAGRVRDLRLQLPPDWRPRRILDFGCGIGHTAQHLAEVFPEAEVVGIDTSAQALARAAAKYGSPRTSFRPIADFAEAESFDLGYTNGVFHHIEPALRLPALKKIHSALVPGGFFALFENNPWNPGTRLVMRRIPFDRDARLLFPRQARRLLREAGFRFCAPTRFLFYFPRALAFLRFTEPWLARAPLGAQYYVLATK